MTTSYPRLWLRAEAAGRPRPGKILLDGVLVIAHSDKEDAAATWKKTYGHHPRMAFVDHGPGGTGGPVAALLRPGDAGSNTAADHITTAPLALTQLPKKYRRGRQTLIRTDSAGGTHGLLSWLAQRGRWLSYSVGLVINEVRDGAWVAELTGDVLDGWPKGMRLIVRKERPYPGAQLRIRDADGMRITCFATNAADCPIAELEFRHRLRAGWRTGAGPPGPPGCATFPCTTPRRTRSGWRSSRLLSTCY